MLSLRRFSAVGRRLPIDFPRISDVKINDWEYIDGKVNLWMEVVQDFQEVSPSPFAPAVDPLANLAADHHRSNRYRHNFGRRMWPKRFWNNKIDYFKVNFEFLNTLSIQSPDPSPQQYPAFEFSVFAAPPPNQ
jgi:hypothetical protein